MTTHDTGFLRPAPASPAADRLFPDDREKFGYVMSLSRAWAHVPAAHHDLFDRLAGEAGADVAAGVLRGDAAWSPPNGHPRRGPGSSPGTRTGRTPATSRRCRGRVTTTRRSWRSRSSWALPIAFSTVDDALGAPPDEEPAASASDAVRAAVNFGRPVAGSVTPSPGRPAADA
jgi:hypothetical protein